MEKCDLLPQQLLLEGTIKEDVFFTPELVPLEYVHRVHDPLYVKKLINLKLTRSEIRRIGFPLSKSLINREFLIAGGTLMGAEKALDFGISMNIAGGTHHAYPDRGEAFCLLNDQAIAAKFLLDAKKVKKILILDLDVHQGNGTAFIFNKNPNVFTCSVHGAKNYPFKKEISDLDIPIEDECKDAIYLNIIKKLLPKLYDEVRPNFIFYLSGVDVLKNDKLGRLSLSINGCKKRDEIIISLCKERNIPIQISMGGGYSESIDEITLAHCNTYSTAKEIFF